MENEDTDEQLAVAVAAGNAQAFRLLAARWMPRGYAIARRTLSSPQDAEEAVQDAFTKLWINAASFQSERGAFSTWFYRIVVNTCLDRRRKRKPIALDIDDLVDILPDDAPNPETILTSHKEAQRLRCAVETLPPRQRMAVTLCYFEEMTNVEAAAAMQVHVKALEGLLVRARRSLREYLRINDDEGRTL